MAFSPFLVIFAGAKTIIEDKDMKATISLDSLWATIQSLSINNQKWLASKLQENIRAKEEAEAEYISKEELLAGIRSGLEDLKAGRTQSFDDFIKELESDAI